MLSNKKNNETEFMLKMSGSPMQNEMRKSANYLTPGKSQRSMFATNINSSQIIADTKLYKMIENCVKMECAGCRKLIPTHLFFDHLMQNTV